MLLLLACLSNSFCVQGTRLKSGELRPEAIERINKLLQKPKKSKTDATAQPSSEQNCVSSYNDLPSAHGSTSKGEHSSPASQESIPHTANDLLDHRTENVSNPIDKGSASFDADQLSAFVSWPSQFQVKSTAACFCHHGLD